MTKEEIKNSVEYKSSMFDAKYALAVFGIISFLGLLVALAVAMANGDLGLEAFKVSLIAWAIVEAFFVLAFGSVLLYILNKAHGFLKNYEKYKPYEATLDNPSTSYAFRASAVYYTVAIDLGTTSKEVKAEPCFSSSMFTKFDIKDFNNKKVLGLYDEKKERFYIIRVI
ncbi:MAG: hypothetical protein LKG11_00075 [Bacilli bacterium]|jgi:small-conductance mechanosensitive channel|nr:hypothetical protein [Bacilli bacterium]